jgi:hypothetical protein
MVKFNSSEYSKKYWNSLIDPIEHAGLYNVTGMEPAADIISP